jgi:hypothetical protein
MSTAVLDTAALIPASLHARLRREANFSAFLEELAGLRFSIVLLARWQASGYVDEENRAELCHELARLRSLYFDTIDEMAMTFSVQQAMDAQNEVERTVEVPCDMMPPLATREDEQLFF